MRAVLESAIAARLTVVEHCQAYAVDGSVPVTSWVDTRARCGRTEAARTVGLARRLDRYRLVSAALAAGELTVGHAQVLGRALDALPEHLRARQEPLFVALARLTDPHTLDLELRNRTDALDTDGADRAEDHDLDRNRVQLAKTLGGRWHLRGDLDPLSGATLRTALDAIRRTDHSAGDLRSPGQRDADALTALGRQALDHAGLPAVYGARPHLIVNCTLDQLHTHAVSGPAEPSSSGPAPNRSSRGGSDLGASGLSELDLGASGLGELTLTGDPIRPRTLDRLACDSTLTRIVLDGAGQVLDVGRSHRSVPWHLWIALISRHPGCWISGCTEPVQRTEAHHAQPFSEGGTTSLTNSVLLCSRRGGHHDQLHHGTPRQTRHGRWLGPHGYLEPEPEPERDPDPP